MDSVPALWHALVNLCLFLVYEWQKLGLLERWAALSLFIGVPVAYVYETVRYARLLGKPDTVHLAPVSVTGDVLEGMGSRGVALALRAELVAITDLLTRVLGERPAPYFAPAAGRNTGYYLVGLRQEAPIPVVEREQELEIKQRINLKVGTVSVPVSELADFIIAVLTAIRVPFRNTYKRSTIKVSMVAIGGQSQLIVSLDGRYAGHPEMAVRARVRRAAKRLRPGRPGEEEHPRPAGKTEMNGGARPAALQAARTAPTIFTVTRPTTTLTEVGELIRDAAFMILQIHGSFKGRHWQSMRCLFDGLAQLDEYRRTGTPASRQDANRCFERAAAADPLNNHEALYYHGVMTMVERTSESIDEAQRYFEMALKHARDPGDEESGRQVRQLRALLHTGLAYCCAQQYHRLGRFDPAVLKDAEEHALKARDEWPDASGDLHPLIPYTLALVSHVDEGSPDDNEERVGRFERAAGLYQQAITLQPDNGMFYNNLGWVLLKLAEWGQDQLRDRALLDLLDDLPSLGNLPSDTRVAPLAEKYFRHALGLNPTNKLTHANLCLLYSTAWFRDPRRQVEPRQPPGPLAREDAARVGNSVLARCRYHGLKAIQLDRRYINGYRDLAVALVRWGKLDEARKHYEMALDLADDPDKDQEIIRDLNHELDAFIRRTKTDLSESTLKSWREPPDTLLLPRLERQPPTEGAAATELPVDGGESQAVDPRPGRPRAARRVREPANQNPREGEDPA